MLAELFCEKFSYGNSREKPIKFFDGLNIILGGEKGDNSIGKSSFLQILDFVFAGETYGNSDLIKRYGHHTIYFAFLIDCVKYCFGRSTDHIQQIIECDNLYKNKGLISLSEYKRMLMNWYQLNSHVDEFRFLVCSFFKFYADGRPPISDPLRFVSSESMEDGIKRFLKLFNAFAPLDLMLAKEKNVEKRQKAYDAAAKAELLPKATKGESKCLAKNIEILQKDLDELQNDYMLNSKILKKESLTDTEQKLADLSFFKSKIKLELSLLKRNRPKSTQNIRSDYSELQHYFPTANIRSIEDIDQFHESLKNVLQEEIEDAYKKVQQKLTFVENAIIIEKKRKNDIESTSNEKKLLLNLYAEKKSALDKLLAQKKLIDEIVEIKKIRKNFKKEYEERFIEIAKPIEEKINHTIKNLNKCIDSALEDAPHLCFESSKAYKYGSSNDCGSGTKAKDILLFHLALLEVSSAPILIHDTFDLKQIQNSSIVNLIKLCNDTSKGKQKFLAIDKVYSLNADSDFMQIIDEKTVLKLDSKQKLFTN